VKTEEVALPFSNGTLSARMWKSGSRIVVGVPELGLHCYGKSKSEVVFRLFTSLIKYYRQLSQFPDRLTDRGLEHLALLRIWIKGIEARLTEPKVQAPGQVVYLDV
jgi:hypothetical protein